MGSRVGRASMALVCCSALKPRQVAELAPDRGHRHFDSLSCATTPVRRLPWARAVSSTLPYRGKALGNRAQPPDGTPPSVGGPRRSLRGCAPTMRILAANESDIPGEAQVPRVSAAIYHWCVRMVEKNVLQGDYEQAASWAWIAGSHAYLNGFFGMVSDPELESLLLSVGRKLPHQPSVRGRSRRLRYLHVLTEAYEIGGHTRLCQRWVELDSPRHPHSVVLTAQCVPVPSHFKRSIVESGGDLTVFDPETSLVERALRLRRLACEQADIVVLHTHMQDPMTLIAFAVESVPPVVLVNHAESVFWLGGSIADLVLDVNRTANERTKRSRGISESMILPIPLGDVPSASGVDPAERNRERARLGIAEDSIVFLTAGSGYKYNAIGDYDFVPAALQLLRTLPQAHLLAVGPSDAGAWSTAASQSGGRLRALGTIPNLAPLHACSDVYLEGFPCGSLTALLEAGLAGLPCVRNPLCSSDVARSDDPAIEHVPSPKDVEAYIKAAVELGKRPDRRRQEGARLQRAIVDQHCGDGWRRRLESVEAHIPNRHRICRRVARPVPKHEAKFWMRFRHESIRHSGLGKAMDDVHSAARRLKVRMPEGVDDLLVRELLLCSRAGLTSEGNLSQHLLLLDGRFAWEHNNWSVLRRDFFQSLMLAPFTRANLELAGRFFVSLLGAKAAKGTRSIKRRMTTTSRR
jgi:hypothetical protein